MKHRGEYPCNWSELAIAVKSDACFKCVRCDHKHDPKSGYTLTVHHFDGDKSNCERWNLMALCQRCHLSVQNRVDPTDPLMFDPADWARPYIAGFYLAGRGMPAESFNLMEWIKAYEDSGRGWPRWAAWVPIEYTPSKEVIQEQKRFMEWCKETELKLTQQTGIPPHLFNRKEMT